MLHFDLRSCFNPEVGGIFDALSGLPVPWADDVPASVLDTTYLYVHSGSKPPSPVVSYLVSKRDQYLTADDVDLLANMVYNLNHSDWDRLWEAEGLQYNPISNYDMTEQKTGSIEREYGSTNTETRALTHSSQGSDSTQHGESIQRTDNLTRTRDDITELEHGLTQTHTGTDSTQGTTTPNLTTSSEHSVSGFNSSSPQVADTDQSTQTGSTTESETVTYNTTEGSTGTDTTTLTGSERDTGTQTTAHSGTDTTTRSSSGTDGGTVTTGKTGSDTDTEDYILTRSGNIGVTTTQQMLESERQLRQWRFFQDFIFPNVDAVLTLCVY